MKSKFYFAKNIGLLLWVLSQAGASPTATNYKDNYDKVELINPIQLDQVLGVTPYESVSKLILAVSLPQPGLMSEGQDVVETTMEIIRKEFGNSLVPRFHQRAPPHSILAKTSNFAFGTEDQMKTYINIMNTQNEHKGFSLFLHNTTSFEKLMGSKLQEIQADAKISDNSTIEPSTVRKYTEIFHDLVKSSLISCFNRTLPEELVGQFAREKIQEIHEEDLLPPGYKLAIPPDNFPLYLNQTLTDCLFTSERIYVVVNVPVVREQAKWMIYRANHPKFVFMDKICSAGPAHDKFYAFDANLEQVLELDSNLNLTCKMDGFNQLCLMPPLPQSNKRVSSKTPSKALDKEDTEPANFVSHVCTAGILNKLPLKELKEECGFICTFASPDEYFFKEMSSHTVYLTNTKKARIFCPNTNLTKTFERIGAVKVELHTCDCYLWAEEEFYSFRSCLYGGRDETMTNFANDFDISYLIPLTWTKNHAGSMVMEDRISFRIKNYKEIIDFDWLKRMTGEEKDEVGFGAKYWNLFDDY